MNAFTRWMQAALTVMLLALLFGGGWFYRVQEQTMQQENETDLSAVVRLKAQQIKAWREERLGDAAVLQENPLFVREVARFQADPRDENTMEIRAIFQSFSKHYSYADVLLVDPDGRVRLSLSGQTGVHGGYASTLAAALRDRKPVFADLYAEAQDPTPHISVIAPLFTGDEQAPKPVGAVILVCDASRFLYPALQSWPTPTKSAETLLVGRDGKDVLFLNDLRHQPDTALKLRIPLSRTDVPSVMAVLGHEGVVMGKDYRGVEVLSFILPVPDSPWYMVAKMDADEVFAVRRFRSGLILALLMGLVGMVVLLGLVVRQQERKNLYRTLYQSEFSLRASVERHSITLKAIGEAVIATDVRGRVELLNPVAEVLTGWNNEEARGRPLGEIFRIVNEQTRAEVEDPVARALKEGVVVGLANHTLLIAKDGAERPIADSGAPIRADDGTLIGVVLVFSDRSVERRAQRLTQVRLDLIEYAAAHTLDELLTKTLDEVGAFLDSPIGFYHFVESDQKTLLLQQWSTRTLKEFCRAEGKGLHYSIDQAGVWVDCVQERKPVIHNDYRSLEHKKGMPEGHAKVVRELVAPVMREGKVVAILGVGNKPVDYTEKDAETVAYLADVTWEIVERKLALEELNKYRDHLEDLVKERTTELAMANEQLTREVEERRRAEEALKEASEKLKFFAYSVAHDLKSPAIGVYGLTKRLIKHAKNVLDENGRIYCEQILKVSEHIAALVEKINVYIATKEAAPLIETINMSEIVRMLRDEFSAQFSLRRIDLLAPESEVKIEADRLSILRIFTNLIDNALKYGGVSLTRISIGYEDSENLHIFSVSDNGKGLKEADSEKIFGLFQRNETSRGVEGAGLGLTIVREIAEQHGGRVWLEPRGKKGITFYVSISKNL